MPSLPLDDFLRLARTTPVLDVRTPAEFAHAHVPGARNLPLFSDEERVRVGTTYKQKGREAAILLGFDLTGSKWSGFIRRALVIAPNQRVLVHCWRGGMRSAAMAWALELYGFEVQTLEGGYKRYRNGVLAQFDQPYHLRILGGLTGSGKTYVLHELARRGEQVIDLEALANHRGSAYGATGTPQPSREQFENELAHQLAQLDPTRPTWLEDESIAIGSCLIPNGLWHQMRQASVRLLQVPRPARLDFLTREYGQLDPAFLTACTLRIAKRLGPLQTIQAVAAIEEGRMGDFVDLALVYYDKTYPRGLADRPPDTIHPVDCPDTDPVRNATALLTQPVPQPQEL